MAAIVIRGLSKSYAGAAGPAAVSDLSLDIADGQFVTLLGPSGCGKTTTLRLIAGFIAPDAGTIHADDRLVSSPERVVPPEERGMGMVFQNYAVWPHKTVFENIAFGLKLRKVPAREARMRVENALALVNLTGLQDRLPSELSGGQQQRVALARSLVVEPQILLLDEPLSNLDAKLRERMRVELKQLQRRTGITFVYVTHDQAEALALSDRIAVIHGGRLVQVVVNLLVNAAQAIPKANAPAQAVTVATRSDGRTVEIEVSDTGVGIGPENLSRIWTPFFTTKRNRGGTGLGLAITSSLVRAHGGRLSFSREPKGGTRAVVILPLGHGQAS